MSTFAPHDPQARALFDQIRSWPIYDPHSHIDAHRPASRNLDEVLGYHYYTELAHSAGMPAAEVDPGLDPSERCKNLARHLHRIDNTVQYSWLLEIARTFFDFDGDRIDADTVEGLIRLADHSRNGEEWDRAVWQKSRLEAVFLTNEFDDPLEGWDTSAYVPCLRTDDLVMKLHEPRTLQRLMASTNVDIDDVKSLRMALASLFEHFTKHGARACAISLPPDFVPRPATPVASQNSVRRALKHMDLRPDEHEEVRSLVFWTLAELCDEWKLPFDLMIGPVRNVYPDGVTGGRDLFDRRVSLNDYAPLFNHFSNVTFPVSTLAPDAGAELVAFSWIFPNVVPNGHWWYSNVPSFIADDLKARLQAVPKTKLVGYYSDAYKLEFILPKVNMYRRLLAEYLAEDCIRTRGWTEDRALELARLLLLDNPRRIFARPGDPER